jgi:hypothetical protein
VRWLAIKNVPPEVWSTTETSDKIAKLLKGDVSYRWSCGIVLLGVSLSANNPGRVKTLIDRKQMGIVFCESNELDVVSALATPFVTWRKIVLCAASAPAFLHGQNPQQSFESSAMDTLLRLDHHARWAN